MEKNNKLKILLVGQAQPWDVGFPFKKAFELLGAEVIVFESNRYYFVGLINRILNKGLKILGRVRKKLGTRAYFGIKKLNEAVLERAREIRPHLVLFGNMIFIKPETVVSLQKIEVKVFAWHNHDINDLNNTSRNFYKTIPLCDYHLTTKSYQLDDFRTRGARGVAFIPFASDANLYYPEEIHEEEKKKLGADIIFIGSYYEDYRAEILDKLCRRGYNLKVYGNRWEMSSSKCLKEKALMFRPAEGNDYRRAMNASKIALGLLAKVIPEQHTHRTFEIPACGTFMLHERTREAMSFFEGGKEAEFFSSFDELVKKIDYYLEHEEERKKIAAAGLKRARSYEHSYLARAQKIINAYLNLKI